MKPLLYTITLLLALMSIQYENDLTTNRHTDSLQIGDTLFYLDSISENDFLKIQNPGYEEGIDTSIVKVFKDSIQIKAKNKLVVLSNYTPEGESMAYYYFKAMIPSPGYVHIEGIHWESTSDSYINLKNGSETNFWDNPLLSPDKQSIIAWSCDIEIGYMFNGIQFFKVNSDSITQIFEMHIDEWCPYKIKWESDSSLVIKRMKLDKDGERVYDYVRMNLKPKQL